MTFIQSAVFLLANPLLPGSLYIYIYISVPNITFLHKLYDQLFPNGKSVEISAKYLIGYWKTLRSEKEGD